MATKMHSLFTTGSDADDARREAILDWLEAHVDQVICDLDLVPIEARDEAYLRTLQTEARHTVDRAIQQLDRALAQTVYDSAQLDALRQRRHTLAQWPGLPEWATSVCADTTREVPIVDEGCIVGVVDLYASFYNLTPYVHPFSYDDPPWTLDPDEELPEWGFSGGNDDASFVIVPSVTHQRDLRARLAALQQAHVYNLVLVSDREGAQATRALAASMDVHFYQINC